MITDDCVAMVLAGGRGKRLGALTRYYAKPAVHFGGCNRIIDFTLSNCRQSGIDTVGILTQYFSADLHAYISAVYNNDEGHGRMYMLPPKSEECQYIATADAVYQNIGFIDRFQPEHVLVLAGDHIYRMDYNGLIAFHKDMDADVTVSAKTVPWAEAHRYGNLSTYPDGRINSFEEKPRRSKSNLASMGVYIFKWAVLKRHLIADNAEAGSRRDFGKDIIPRMLSTGESMYSYEFGGYWRDAGTLDSLWEANMDLLANPPGLQIRNDKTNLQDSNPCFKSGKSETEGSIISENCTIFGKVRHSVLGDSVTVCTGAEIVDSVVMPGAYIGENVKIYKSIVGTRAQIMNNAEIGMDEGIGAYIDRQICKEDISLVAPWAVIPEGMRFKKNSQIYPRGSKSSLFSIAIAQ